MTAPSEYRAPGLTPSAAAVLAHIKSLAAPDGTLRASQSSIERATGVYITGGESGAIRRLLDLDLIQIVERGDTSKASLYQIVANPCPKKRATERPRFLPNAADRPVAPEDVIAARAETGWTLPKLRVCHGLYVLEGLSATETGSRLGVSKNSVIGIALRQEWGRSPQAQAANNSRLAGYRERPAAKPKAAPKPAVAKPPEQPRLAKPEAMTATTDLMHLGAHMCKWPIGDPKEAGFGFCGRRKAEGDVYCAPHKRLAYQPRQKKGWNLPPKAFERSLRKFA